MQDTFGLKELSPVKSFRFRFFLNIEGVLRKNWEGLLVPQSVFS